MGLTGEAEQPGSVQLDLGPSDRRRLTGVVLVSVIVGAVPALVTVYVLTIVVFGSTLFGATVVFVVLLPIVLPVLLHKALASLHPPRPALAVLLPVALAAVLLLVYAGIAIEVSGLADAD